MGAPLIFTKHGGMLVPAGDDAESWLVKRKTGQNVVLDPVLVRNVDRLKLYWVFMGIVAENHNELTTKEAADQAVRILAGFFDVVSFKPEGSAQRMFIRVAKSIAITNCKEPEFEAFIDRVLEVIQSQLLPGVDVEELRKEGYLRAGCAR